MDLKKNKIWKSYDFYEWDGSQLLTITHQD